MAEPTLFGIFLKVCGVSSHTADVGTDFRTGILYLLRGDLWWGSLTIGFVILSMVIGTWLLYREATDEDTWNWPRHRARLLLICFPVVPLGSLIYDLVVTTNQYRDNRSNSSGNGANDNGNNTSDGINNIYSELGSSNANNINNGNSGSIANNKITTVNSINTQVNNNNDSEGSNVGVNTNNDSNSTTSVDLPPHVGAAGLAKFNEAMTESFPQSCIGTHVIMQTTYCSEPGVEATVDWIQYISLVISVLSLAAGIATNPMAKNKTKTEIFVLFIVVLPFILGRLLLWGSMGTIHPAMFILPLGTELLAGVAIWALSRYSGAKLRKWKTVMVLTSSISSCYAIGGFFTPVDLAVAITSMVINVIAGLLQIVIWWNWDDDDDGD